MKTALIIGDSHVDSTPFGIKLQSKLERIGYHVIRAGVGATSAKSWVGGNPCTPDKKNCVLVAELPKNADLLLISLGTNDGANAGVGTQNREKEANLTVSRVQEIVNKFDAKRAIWILPPWQRGNVKYYTPENMSYIYAAADNIKGVELINSADVTKELVINGSGDGVHPGSKCADVWSDAVIKHLNKTSTTKKQLIIPIFIVISLFLFRTRGVNIVKEVRK